MMEGSYREEIEKYELSKILEECNHVLEFVLEIADDLEDVSAPRESHIKNQQSVYWNFFGEEAVEAYGKLKEFGSEGYEETRRFETILQEARTYENLPDKPSQNSAVVHEYRENTVDQKLF